ncbi:MAG: amidohydrolase family protein [Deltaproteobacteria bacterium]|nr:amidohydrolase family protein [Deltaproteobacteria bacterium]
MKRAFKSFIAFALLIPILMSCNGGMEEVMASQPSETNEQVTAFTNVNLVPMTDETIVKDQTVLIKKTRILEIGPSNEVSIPKNAVVINGAGAYLMPGLADMHMHTRPGWVTDYPVSPLNLYLANGVTTIRCFGPRGGSGKYVLRWRDEIKRGKRIGPTIYTCGPILYGPVKDPRGVVHGQKAQGFDFVKLYSFVSKDEFHKAIATAKNLGIYTAGHIPFSVGLDGVLSEGMNEIAHIEELDFEFLDFDRTKNLGPIEWFRYLMELTVQQWGKYFGLDMEGIEKRYGSTISAVISKVQSAHVPICTTLVVGEGIVQKLFEPEVFLARPEITYLPQWYLDAFRHGKEKHQVMFRGHEDFAPFKHTMERILLRKLKQAGIFLLLSTDAGTGSMGIVPGFSIHDELRILTENGFTPYEAIAAGTINASKIVKAMIGVDDFGTIEEGKRADLLLVNENPLEDVASIKDLRGVMTAGRWYEKAALQKMILPGIPIIGAIKNGHEPDKSLKTTIEVIIGKGFTGNLPDDIDTITVTGPKGDLTIGKDDFTYIPQLRDFFIRLPGSPAIGTYTFKVTSGTMSGSATDIQSVVRTIPLADISTFSPAIGATLRSNTPTFSWGAVKAEVPIYYRLEIYKQHGSRIYSTGYVKSMFSHTVPDGVLKPGQAYRWRVRVADGDTWNMVQNRSYSDWHRFAMAKALE